MHTTTASKNIIRTAKTLSIVFSPLFAPVYGMVIALTMTPLQGLPPGTRWISLLVIAVFTGILPLFLLYLMKRTGRISDIDITNRRQRTRPLIMILVCYTLTLLYISFVHAPMWLVMYFASGVVSAVALGIVTVVVKWKISMHGAGMGNLAGLCTALIILGMTHNGMMILLSAIILIAGMVGSSRVILQKHTLMQVFSGFTSSALITFLLMTQVH